MVHWLRRDLRLDDNPALAAAVRSGAAVASAFVLDPRLLDGECAAPLRVGFLLEGLADLDARLRRRGGGLLVRSGEGEREIAALAASSARRRCTRAPTTSRSRVAATCVRGSCSPPRGLGSCSTTT